MKTDKFEIVETTKGFRLIISNDNEGINTIGLQVQKKDLYELYSLLRIIFNSEEE